MDASRLINIGANAALNLPREVAARMDLADAMRDLADEIEAGKRIVTELLTYEQIRLKECPVSILHIVSVLNKKVT
jgi:hypothetical protein